MHHRHLYTLRQNLGQKAVLVVCDEMKNEKNMEYIWQLLRVMRKRNFGTDSGFRLQASGFRLQE
jgi:hypothetical protein